jgi:hypothetical protein
MKKTSGEQIMADKQSRDLETLFDEELMGSRAELLQRRLADNDKNLQAEWEVLGLIRDGAQSWYKERCTDEAGNPCTCDIWDRVAPQLRQLPVPCESKNAEKFGDTWIGRALAGLSQFALRPVPAAAFGIVLVVGVVALMQSPIGSSELTSQQIASSTNVAMEEPSLSEILKRSSDRPPLSGRIAFGRRGTASQQAALVGFRPGERREVYSRSPIDSDSTLARERALAEGNPIEVDWIRSKRSIQFVRPQDRNAPPVIWLASQ